MLGWSLNDSMCLHWSSRQPAINYHTAGWRSRLAMDLAVLCVMWS